MATSKKISPSRRKSIAGVNQNQPSLVPKNRRRAHSIVPGATLSPLAKARRSLAPRKSILKASVGILNIDPSSQQTQSSADDDATRSMDMTRDFTAQVHSRKSLGRRVSFARHSHVRMFETNHTNSTGSPQSSPSSISASPNTTSHHDAPSNENDYPGQKSRNRRSSVRFSMAGSEDMDLTTVIAPGDFQVRGSAILDEEFGDYDDEDDSFDDDNMDVTEAIQGGLARKRSLSMGRQPLSQILAESEAEEGDESRSEIGNDSTQSEGVSGDIYQGMEFTIPLGQSLRPPPEQDEVWLALKQMTHSGNEPSEAEPFSDDVMNHPENDGMNLDDAMERLRHARDSLPHPHMAPETNQTHDDTFTSTEDSFDNDNDEIDSNQTLNLSKVMSRASLGANSRMSMGYQDSNMDESEVYGNIASSTPRHSLLPPREESESAKEAPSRHQSSVFLPPPPDETSVPISQTAKATPSGAFSFTVQPPPPTKSNATSETPSKSVKPKPTFSAAFAPPVTRPSPKKSTAASIAPQSPAKRARPLHDTGENLDVNNARPAKKQALADKWLGVTEAPSEPRSSPEPIIDKSTTSEPKPLLPSKRALFEVPSTASAAPESRPPSALRRPSGYFAKRKSLAVSFNIPSSSQENAPSATPPSPKKKPATGAGRASLGSAPADAWRRFDKNAGSGPGIAEKEPAQKLLEKEVEAAHCIREATRQRSASPSPTRGSPAPARIATEPSSPERRTQPHVIDVSTIVETPEEGDLSEEMQVDVDATQQWRQGIEQTEHVEEEEETPDISIGQFFIMTGIKFMDELTAPRRSIHPSQQPIRKPRNPVDIPLAEYVTAMAIDVPQLDLYSRVSKDLEGWMSKSKVVFAQAEEEAAKVTPELFVEYARADEEGQAELLHQLNLIRTHARYLARSDWYDWKHQWVEGLRATADEAFASLENDARTLEGLKKSADAILPELESEYEQLVRELEKEQAEVKEIEESDQEYLNELKATVAEQNIEIEALKAELTEGTDQLRWLQEKLDEIEAQKNEAKNTISTAERILHMKQTSTRSEVFRLKGELEALEDLHMFRITKVNANLFEYVYSSLFQVSIPCKDFMPLMNMVNITRYGKQSTRYKDNFPKLSSFLLSAAKHYINEGEDLSVRQIVHRLNDYWSSCAQLRSQLTLLSIKYPVEIVLSTENPTPLFKARAAVLFPSAKAKAFIDFLFSFDTFSQWPMSLGSLDCEVKVAYGPVDRSEIMKTVMARLSQATPAENYACLLDACIEAQDIYQ